MPFCPECEAEYEAGVATCTDCGAALVEELAPRDEPPPDTAEGDPVPFMNFANSAEANMVADLLEENGIRAYVSGGEFTVAPSMFAGEIVLMVDERDLDRAADLYDAYFGDSATLRPESDAESAPAMLSEEVEDEGRE